IEEPQPGFLIVEEYRDSGGSPAEFPGGVETSGLAALALIFHPYYAGNFDMTCEGLTRWNGTPAWQVHFRQRRDKPNTVRSYRLGLEGPSYPVALNGRVRPAARQELATQAKPFLSRQASQRETGVEAHGGAEESQGISYRVALMQNSGV